MANKEAIFRDEFVADEILARLPARFAARCIVLSKGFRQLLRSPHFWLCHRRLGAPGLELPHAACLYKHDVDRTFYFHLVGSALAFKHTVNVQQFGEYVNTCNGLVLISDIPCFRGRQSSVDGVVFNPATKEEVRLSMPLPEGKTHLRRFFLGFGYAPSSKVYKALICVEGHHSTRLMVVSLGCQQEPRTLFSFDDVKMWSRTLYMGGGKVYIIIYMKDYFKPSVMLMLAFDVDDEIITRVALPEKGFHITFDSMLVVCGRPCIYMDKGQDTVLWLLTTDHRWERRFTLVKQSSGLGDYLSVVWDCGGGLLFAKSTNGAYLYNLGVGQAAGEEDQGGGTRLKAVSSLKIEYKRPEQFKYITRWRNLRDYQLTLISPASIFGHDLRPL